MHDSPEPGHADILALCDGFSRVQINLHGDYFNRDAITVKRDAIMRFADQVPCAHVILQHRAGWDAIPARHDSIEYLFDRSEGAGIEALHEWPAPPAGNGRTGYAGGIGPGNIRQALAFINKYPDNRMWLDMEGRIRTLAGDFDHAAAEAVLSAAF